MKKAFRVISILLVLSLCCSFSVFAADEQREPTPAITARIENSAHLSEQTKNQIRSFLNGEKGYYVYDADGNVVSLADIKKEYMETASMLGKSRSGELSANNVDFDVYLQMLANGDYQQISHAHRYTETLTNGRYRVHVTIQSLDIYENESSYNVYMDAYVSIDAYASYIISFNSSGNQIVSGATIQDSEVIYVSYADLPYDDAYSIKSQYATYTSGYASFSSLGTVEFYTTIGPNDEGYDPGGSLDPDNPDGSIPVLLRYDNVGFQNYRIFASDIVVN